MKNLLIVLSSFALFLNSTYGNGMLKLENTKSDFNVKFYIIGDSIPPVGCIKCHQDLFLKPNKHDSKTNKVCEDCHLISPLEHPKEKVGLLKKMPELCFSCHEATKDLVSNSGFVHKPVSDEKSCSNCHSSHSSDQNKLLVSNRKDLCISCHNKPIVTDNKTLSNFEKLRNATKVLHPPFEDCEKICHNPHASNDSRLLDIAFPKNNYLSVSADSFALCWECHGSDMIEKPISKGASSFRNGDRNLHYLHVHGEKGRNCVICHSPHATNNEHLIREKVSFGKWEFNMNYTSDENGGSCAPACHSEKKYVR